MRNERKKIGKIGGLRSDRVRSVLEKVRGDTVMSERREVGVRGRELERLRGERVGSESREWWRQGRSWGGSRRIGSERVESGERGGVRGESGKCVVESERGESWE